MKITKEKADKAYEKGKPIITDETYDKMFGSEASALLVPDKTPWKKFTHTLTMASLSKVEVITPENDVDLTNMKAWLAKRPAKSYLVSPKADGCAIKLYYDNGKLIRAVTRGDGTVGEDVTRNILKAKNVLPEIPDKYITEIIGEVVLPKPIFNKYLLGFMEYIVYPSLVITLSYV